MLTLTIIGDLWTWESLTGFIIFAFSVLAILIWGPRYRSSLILKNKNYYTADEIAFAEKFLQQLNVRHCDEKAKKYHTQVHIIMIVSLTLVFVGLFFPGIIHAFINKIT